MKRCTVADFNRFHPTDCLRVDTREKKSLRQCIAARAKWRVGVATRFTRVPTIRIHSHTFIRSYVHTFIYSLNDGKHSTTHCQVVTVVPCVLICLPPEPLPSPSGVSTDPSEYQETPEAHVSAPSFPCVQRSSTRLHLIAPVVPIVDHIFSLPRLLSFSLSIFLSCFVFYLSSFIYYNFIFLSH